jgi:Protein of unknown function (DUF3237)
VLRGGGGLSLIRRDEVLEVDVRLTLDTEDKHQISMAWKGLRHGPKEVMDRLYRGETTNRTSLNDPHLNRYDDPVLGLRRRYEGATRVHHPFLVRSRHGRLAHLRSNQRRRWSGSSTLLPPTLTRECCPPFSKG